MSEATGLIAQLRAMPEGAREAWFTSNEAYPFVRETAVFVEVCTAIRPRGLPTLAERLVQRSPMMLPLAQALVVAGLCERPVSEAYVLGLINLPWQLRDRSRIDAMLAADPGLAAAMLRVFEVEGTAEVSLASSDKYNHAADLAWPEILLALVGRGVTTPADLLARTLGALANDWPAYRSGWFSRFHARLAPEVADMAPHREAYLALAHSRIAATVTLAVEALQRLDAAEPIPRERLFGALRPVFAGAVKAQVEAALKLVDRVVAREAEAAADAAALVVDALLLEAAPVQKAVLKRLAAWGVDAALRERLAGVAGAIAAVNQPAYRALAGEPVAAAAAPVVPAAPAAPASADPLDDARRVAVPADDAALVELVAQVFESEADVDGFEAAVAGIAALAPFDAARRRTLAPVLKRAAKVRKPLGRLLARLLVEVVEQRTLEWSAGIDPGGNASPVQAMLLRRIDALAAFARQGGGAVPLATPTHRRGFIAPAVLVERAAAHQAAGLGSEPIEQVLALLRLAPGAGDAVRAQARRLRDGPWVRALRHALGDAVELDGPAPFFAAAARIRHPGADDEAVLRRLGDLGPDAARVARFAWEVETRENVHEDRTYRFHDLIADAAPRPRESDDDLLAVARHAAEGQARQHFRWWSFGGWDDGSIAWSATLLPSDPEAFCAEGARAIGGNLDWWEAQWHNTAYLRLLLDPTVRFAPMATLLLALGLLGKEPGQTAIAVDALVAGHAEGRLDVPALGATLRRLFATPMPKAARLVASLRAALRADAGLRGAAFALLAEVVLAEPAPREVAALLDLLLELKLTTGAELPAATRRALATSAWSGRAKTVCRELVG